MAHYRPVPPDVYAPKRLEERLRPPPMPTKHTILSELSAEDLRTYVDHYGLEVDDRRVKTQLADALVQCEEATIEEILGDWSRNDLKALCRALDVDDSGRRKADLIARLTATGEEQERSDSGRIETGPQERSRTQGKGQRHRTSERQWGDDRL